MEGREAQGKHSVMRRNSVHARAPVWKGFCGDMNLRGRVVKLGQTGKKMKLERCCEAHPQRNGRTVSLGMTDSGLHFEKITLN